MLEKHDSSYLFDFKFVSIVIFSIELVGTYSLRRFEGNSSLTYSVV